MPITSDNIGYEAMNGLGDDSGYDYYQTQQMPSVDSFTNLSSWINNYAPIPAVTPPFVGSAPSAPGFNWTSLIAPIERTGLQIAANVTNPAYNTPGSFTRLADGTVIATAGTATTGYQSVAPGGSNLLSAGGSLGGLLPLLLIGGVLLMVMGGKK